VDVPEISGFELVAIVVGLIQFLKEKFKAEDTVAEWLTFVTGLVLFGYWSANQAGVMPEVASLWVSIVVRALGYTLAVPGLYKLAKHEILPIIGALKVK